MKCFSSFEDTSLKCCQQSVLIIGFFDLVIIIFFLKNVATMSELLTATNIIPNKKTNQNWNVTKSASHRCCGEDFIFFLYYNLQSFFALFFWFYQKISLLNSRKKQTQETIDLIILFIYSFKTNFRMFSVWLTATLRRNTGSVR